MFQALPVRSTSCRRRRRRSAMSTVRINRAAAAGPLGHDEPRFRACCRGAAVAGVARRRLARLRVSRIAVRAWLSACFLPGPAGDLCSWRAAERKNAATADQPNEGMLRPADFAARVALRRAVARVNPRCRAEAHAAGHKEIGRMHHPAEATPPPRFPTSREPSWLAPVRH